MSFVKEQSFRESRSVIDVREALEHLRVKAVTKVRAFLLEQVYKLRKPMANYQVPQNNLLSKYKYEITALFSIDLQTLMHILFFPEYFMNFYWEMREV